MFTHSINHVSEMGYQLPSPCSVKQNSLLFFLFATFDYNFDFVKVKRLLIIFYYLSYYVFLRIGYVALLRQVSSYWWGILSGCIVFGI